MTWLWGGELGSKTKQSYEAKAESAKFKKEESQECRVPYGNCRFTNYICFDNGKQGDRKQGNKSSDKF